ncbi:hypothetical protein MMC25_004172 [Agyrium rufum]|nr:hypothetical protein [Agyrium rufum]
MASRAFSYRDYTVGWVCALPKEQTASIVMLDVRHADLPSPPRDPNVYTLGSIDDHNVVIACLPKNRLGNNASATVAAHMLDTFPSIKFGLMVGIGGGIPRKVRLGDVVVSAPTERYPGVVQWDYGKAEQGGIFERIGALSPPPTLLLTALAKLESQHEMASSKIPDFLDDLKKNYPRRAPRYLKSDSLKALPFRQDYNHQTKRDMEKAEVAMQDDHSPDTDTYEEEEDERDNGCQLCDPTKLINRKPRDMQIHYGLIASDQVLCFEMEAAGLINDFPCLIIRGICDYADSPKNKDWQEHSAAVAAAYAKELLGFIPLSSLDSISTVVDIMMKNVKAQTTELRQFIKEWIEDPRGKSIFWLKGMAGTGKSTLSRTIAQECADRHQLSASFFFKRGEGDRSNAARFFPTLTTQLIIAVPALNPLICNVVDQDPTILRKTLREQFHQLIWQPLFQLQSQSQWIKKVVIVIDALDECDREGDIKIIILLLSQLQELVPLRTLVTSRPELPIRLGFKRLKEGSYQDFILQDIPPPIVKHDILVFLRHEFAEFRASFSLNSDWPKQEDIDSLVCMAIPLFNFAKTICLFVKDLRLNPKQRLAIILRYKAASQASNLDRTYLPVLDQLLVGQTKVETARLIKEFQEVVGAIIVLASPLSVVALAELL